MPRPTSINDIPAYARTGDTLITVQLSQLAVSSKVLAAAASLLAAVEKTPGVSVRQEHSQITVTKDKTPEELAESVRLYQNEWDANQEKFLRWQENGVPASTNQYTLSNVLSWAKKEGFPEDEYEALRDAYRDAKIRDAAK